MQPGSLSAAQLRSLAKEIHDGTIGSETDWLEWKERTRFHQGPRALCGVPTDSWHGEPRPWPRPAELRRLWIHPGWRRTGSHDGNGSVRPGSTPRLDQSLHRRDGPAWQHRYIDVDNTTVLAIEVDPPRPGDSMHTLKKSYESFDRGAIFVRKSGKTHPAEPEDIENLQQRLQGAQLDLDLTLIGDLPISWFDKQALIATITQIADSKQEAQLRRASQTQAPDALTDAYFQVSRTMAKAFDRPDDRTIEQYAGEVAQWHTQWTEQAPDPG